MAAKRVLLGRKTDEIAAKILAHSVSLGCSQHYLYRNQETGEVIAEGQKDTGEYVFMWLSEILTAEEYEAVKADAL